MEEREKSAGRGDPRHSALFPSPRSERRAFLASRGVTERKAGATKRKGENKRGESGKGEGGLNRCHQLRHVEWA